MFASIVGIISYHIMYICILYIYIYTHTYVYVYTY